MSTIKHLSPAEHYARAEDLLATLNEVRPHGEELSDTTVLAITLQAQVSATLATAPRAVGEEAATVLRQTVA